MVFPRTLGHSQIRAKPLTPVVPSFDPDDISGLEFWLDASDSSTISQSSNSVSEWRDKRNNGRAATQPSSSEQPVTNSGTINGLNAILFSSSENMLLPSELYAIPNDDYTIMIVYANQSTGSTNAFFSFRTGGSTRTLLEIEGAFDNMRCVQSDDSFAFNNNFIPNNADPNLAQLTFDSSVPKINFGIIDDLVDGTNNIQVVPDIDSAYLGQPNIFTWKGLQAEIVIYNRLLTVEEDTNLKDYFFSKWNLS